VWNRDFVDSVQLDVPETLTIGTRAAFSEATRALRDMESLRSTSRPT
jgi:glucose-6-phosphate 1-dehydrogenase